MEKETRNAIQSATQKARRVLEEEFREQLEGVFDIHADGTIAPKAGPHLSAREHRQRDRIVAAIEHKRAGGMKAAEAVLDYLRDAAFTTLNRFVALKMLEARDIVQECISKGDASSGFAEFSGLAPGIKFPDGSGYRLYLECIFDELSTEVKVLFDRRDPSAVLWPKRGTFEALLEILNAPQLAGVWGEDETIGWVYQFFNGQDERRKMREESQAPRNSRELAVRNQFFTPRYVVQFLSDNTLGRIWYEMRESDTQLKDLCEYMVRRPDETWQPRAKKDPRDMRVLDPACGSGHFLLYCFDLLLVMYEEAWADEASPASEVAGKTLREDYPEIADLKAALPGLILRHNLHGVDIDPRCAQIGQLALWMRAQRAFKDFGIGRVERPIITRANIVIAEPMPGEKDLLKEFLAELKEDKLEGLIRRALDVSADQRVPATKAMADSLAELVETVWDGMKLAGEMGTLLKIERDLARAIDKGRAEWEDTLPLFRVADYGLGGITNEKLVRVVPGGQEDFWTKAEKLVFQALADYATAASGSGNARRRLFAEDAAEGFALADLLAKRFDALLMNPPFGLPTDAGQSHLTHRYEGAHTDIYAAFCRRGIELAPAGRIGAITSRSFLVNPRHEAFRSSDIIPTLEILADLGLGVMDGAAVEAAAFVLQTPIPREDRFIASKLEPSQLEEAGPGDGWIAVDRKATLALPGSMLLYSLPESVNAILTETVPLEPSKGTAREGMKSFDDFRFLRLWWEVLPNSIGWGKVWTPYAKGGGYAVYYQPTMLTINWRSDGSELRALNFQINGSTAQVRQASTYWGRSGATYSRRSTGFTAKALPAGHIFATMGPAVLYSEPAKERELYYLLGWLNSRFVRFLIELQANKQNYLTGILKRLPWREPSDEVCQSVLATVRGACNALERYYSCRDADPRFGGLPASPTMELLHEALCSIHKVAVDRTLEALSECDRAIDSVYGVDPGTIREIVDNVGASSFGELAPRIDAPSWQWTLMSSVSAALAVAFGRSPKFQAQSGAMGSCFDEVDFERWSATASESPKPDILVDDPGATADVVEAIERVLDAALPGGWRVDDLDLRRALQDGGLKGFFTFHCEAYSEGGRKAPIYWQIATPSASYSVWLYIHAFTKDTLFRVQNDYVAGKLAHEERQLETMRTEAGPDPVPSQRKTIEAQEGFVEELRTFLDEVKRVAPLWNPDLDDGVIINFAPLWRLVPHHKPWQKELKATWDALRAGKYDWAHLAMHLWPERVVPKCAEDRSLAIAHGLEDVFWYQDDEKWKPRGEPTRPIDALVAERTSAAVKAALKSLLEAPEQAGGARRGRGRR